MDEKLLETFIDKIKETAKEVPNPNGVVRKWDELKSIGCVKAIVCEISRNAMMLISLKKGEVGKIIIVSNSERRNWKRTGRNFAILEEVFKSIGKDPIKGV